MKKILCAAAVAAAACTLTLFSACAEGTAYGLTKKEYAEIYGKVTDVIFDENKSTEASRSAVHYVQVDDYSTVRSTGAFVYFLKECYNNKNFVLSEKPVELTCSYASEAWGRTAVHDNDALHVRQGVGQNYGRNIREGNV